jgi:hypothetical protein
MSGNGNSEWRIKGDELGHCNCDWGCPCQFDALPTHGRCEALIGYEVREGHFGDIDMAGVRWAWLVSWPGAIHEGNGSRQLIVDEGASAEQRDSMVALCGGKHGGPYFEIFATVCPDDREAISAPIAMETDREARTGSLRIEGIAESRAEPIRNPVTGDAHRVRIDLPEGFEYRIAEIGNTAFARATADDPLSLDLENTYAQLNEFDWSNA